MTQKKPVTTKKTVANKTSKALKPAAKKVAAKVIPSKTAKKEETKKKAVAAKTVASKIAIPASKKTVSAPADAKAPVKTVASKAVKSVLNDSSIKIRPTSVDKQKSAPVKISMDKPKNAVPAQPGAKKRLLVSYSNMKEELAQAFREKYPKGYADYMSDLIKVDKPDGTSFYALSMETDDAIYLIKMIVRIDRVEDANTSLFPDAAGDEAPDIPNVDDSFPDADNISDADE